MQAINTFFFGDSICFGQGVSVCHGWVTRIATACHEAAEQLGISAPVFNPSINGDTTRMALERMPHAIQGNTPFDVLVVQFGMNDCNYWLTDKGLPRVSPRAFMANLHEILDRGKHFGASRLFLHTNHPTTRHDPWPLAGMPYEASNRQYNDLIRQVASERPDVVLTDIWAEIDSRLKERGQQVADIVLADGLHLSHLGHDLYFEIVSPRILAALQNLAPKAANPASV
jgi:lysophospholipase L1-like esterase